MFGKRGWVPRQLSFLNAPYFSVGVSKIVSHLWAVEVQLPSISPFGGSLPARPLNPAGRHFFSSTTIGREDALCGASLLISTTNSVFQLVFTLRPTSTWHRPPIHVTLLRARYRPASTLTLRRPSRDLATILCFLAWTPLMAPSSTSAPKSAQHRIRRLLRTRVEAR